MSFPNSHGITVKRSEVTIAYATTAQVSTRRIIRILVSQDVVMEIEEPQIHGTAVVRRGRVDLFGEWRVRRPVDISEPTTAVDGLPPYSKAPSDTTGAGVATQTEAAIEMEDCSRIDGQLSLAAKLIKIVAGENIISIVFYFPPLGRPGSDISPRLHYIPNVSLRGQWDVYQSPALPTTPQPLTSLVQSMGATVLNIFHRMSARLKISSTGTATKSEKKQATGTPTESGTKQATGPAVKH